MMNIITIISLSFSLWVCLVDRWMMTVSADLFWSSSLSSPPFLALEPFLSEGDHRYTVTIRLLSNDTAASNSLVVNYSNPIISYYTIPSDASPLFQLVSSEYEGSVSSNSMISVPPFSNEELQNEVFLFDFTLILRKGTGSGLLRSAIYSIELQLNYSMIIFNNNTASETMPRLASLPLSFIFCNTSEFFSLIPGSLYSFNSTLRYPILINALPSTTGSLCGCNEMLGLSFDRSQHRCVCDTNKGLVSHPLLFNSSTIYQSTPCQCDSLRGYFPRSSNSVPLTCGCDVSMGHRGVDAPLPCLCDGDRFLTSRNNNAGSNNPLNSAAAPVCYCDENSGWIPANNPIPSCLCDASKYYKQQSFGNSTNARCICDEAIGMQPSFAPNDCACNAAFGFYPIQNGSCGCLDSNAGFSNDGGCCCDTRGGYKRSGSCLPFIAGHGCICQGPPAFITDQQGRCQCNTLGGYFIDGDSFCKQCPPLSPAFIGGALLFLVVVGAIAVKITSHPLGKRLLMPIQNLLVYFQVVSLLSLIDFHWPMEVKKTVSYFSIAGLNILQLPGATCYVSPMAQFYLTVFAPVTLLVLFVISYFMVGCYCPAKGKAAHVLLFKSYLNLWAMTFNHVANTMIRAFQSVSRSDVNAFYAMIFGFVLYICVVPPFLFLIARFDFILAWLCGFRTELRLRDALDPLEAPYKKEFRLWGASVDPIWKIVLNVTLVYANHDGKVISISVLIGFLAIAYGFAKPFKALRFNKQQTALMVGELVVLMCGLSFYYVDRRYGVQSGKGRLLMTITYIIIVTSLSGMVALSLAVLHKEVVDYRANLPRPLIDGSQLSSNDLPPHSPNRKELRQKNVKKGKSSINSRAATRKSINIIAPSNDASGDSNRMIQILPMHAVNEGQRKESMSPFSDELITPSNPSANPVANSTDREQA